MNKLSIDFPNEKALEYFKSWLLNNGIQNYFSYMENEEEQDKSSDITALTLHSKENNELIAECGRMDEE